MRRLTFIGPGWACRVWYGEALTNLEGHRDGAEQHTPSSGVDSSAAHGRCFATATAASCAAVSGTYRQREFDLACGMNTV